MATQGYGVSWTKMVKKTTGHASHKRTSGKADLTKKGRGRISAAGSVKRAAERDKTRNSPTGWGGDPLVGGSANSTLFSDIKFLTRL